MRLTDSVAEAAKAAGWQVAVVFSYIVKHATTQILEPKFLNWLRVGVQFDGRQVEPERGEEPLAVAEGDAADVAAVIAELEEEMQEAAGKLEFERAALIRDQINALKSGDYKRGAKPVASSPARKRGGGSRPTRRNH